jgi:hypothetical protein
MTLQELERRVRRLEETVAEFGPEPRRTARWYLERAGQFRNDPVYAEIVRLGRKYRESLRPRPKVQGKRKRN